MTLSDLRHWTSAVRSLFVALVVFTSLGAAYLALRRAITLPDIAPDAGQFWLGAHALLQGLDPKDPAATGQLASELLGTANPKVPGNPYPASAFVLFLPATALDWGTYVTVFRLLNWAAIGVGVVLATLAGAPRDRRAQVMLASVAVAVAYQLRVTPTSLRVGQITPMIVLACGAALWALRDERPRTLGAVAGLGAAVKFVPALVLVGAVVQRRWSAVAVAAAVALGLTAVAAAMSGVGAGGGQLGDVFAVVDHRHLPPWWEQRTPRLTLALWHVRIWLLGVPTAVMVGWAMYRGDVRTALPASALTLAWVGTVLAGGPLYHHAMLLLPALAYALAAPFRFAPGRPAWAVAVALGVATLGLRLVFRGQPADLHWVPMGYLVWGVAAAELAALLRVREASPFARPGAPA
jgi:hypothetical protein